jgi:hypothetical protein
MEKKVIREKGKGKYDLDPDLQKALAKYNKQVLEIDVKPDAIYNCQIPRSQSPEISERPTTHIFVKRWRRKDGIFSQRLEISRSMKNNLNKKNRTRPVSPGRSVENKVIPEKGKGKYDLDLYLQKALAKYHKQVLDTNVSKTNSLFYAYASATFF